MLEDFLKRIWEQMIIWLWLLLYVDRTSDLRPESYSDLRKFFTICFAVDSLLAVYLGNLGGHIVLNSDGSLKNFDQVVLFQKVFLFRKRRFII